MADAATWSKRIAEWRASGLTAREYCETQDFAVAALYWWSSHLRRAAVPERTAPIRLARVERRPSSDILASEEMEPVVSPVAETAGAPSLMIEFAGARVFVGTHVHRAALDVVLDALSERGRGRS